MLSRDGSVLNRPTLDLGDPPGTPMTTRGETQERRCTLRIKCCSIFSVTSKWQCSVFIGRMAILPGVRLSISLAAHRFYFIGYLVDTIEGSLTTMPRPFANTSVRGSQIYR
jgi:hypothetical protein